MAIVVRVTPDQMEAIVEVERPSDEPLDVDAVKRALADARVTYGVDEAACNQFIATVNQASPGTKLECVAARGTPAVNGQDGSVTLAVEYVRNPVGTLKDSGAIDYHNRGSFTPIVQGQLIAHVALPTPGAAGSTVHGTLIKANPGSRAKMTAGQGTKLEANGTELRAAREGDLRCAGDLIEVMDMIRVPGNLDYSVGSIECEGPVRVEGDVLPGFHVHAGGDVWIGGIVDSAEVTASGTVTVAQGILGNSRICGRRGIKAGYVRDAYLESDANILILKEALNCTIVSGDTISITETGRVVGGRLLAQNRIETGIAGHEKGNRTILAAGVNPLKELRAAKLAADMAHAQAVQNRMGKFKEMAQPDQHEILDHLLARADKKHAGSAAELAALGQDKADLAECRIKVRKEIHSGVQIRIGADEITIQEDLQGATFHYDSEAGQVVQVQNRR